MSDCLIEYYGRRAEEYEEIFHRAEPGRQAEQKTIAAAMQELFRGKRVLELACGTGYWTRSISETALHVTALDASPSMLQVARRKCLGPAVRWQTGNAFALENLSGQFDAGAANFWLSHVSRLQLIEFLDRFHSRLEPGAAVFMADNVFVPGLGGGLLRRTNSIDTMKRRTLRDGSSYEILKNYYDRSELVALFEPRTVDLRIEFRQCFWWVSYRTGANREAAK